jgi:hypothetical protein
MLALPFKSKMRLEAENAVLRHQLIVLRRRLRGRARFTNNDRWFFIRLYRWFPSILQVLTIVQPETLVRWHRAGFRCYRRWKSRPQGGRPQIHTELRALIRRMNVENPLWGAPRFHGELHKLGLRSLNQALPNTWTSDAGHDHRRDVDNGRRDGGTIPRMLRSSHSVLLYLSADYQDQRRGLRFRGHSLSAFEHLSFERACVYKVHSDLTPFAS